MMDKSLQRKKLIESDSIFENVDEKALKETFGAEGDPEPRSTPVCVAAGTLLGAAAVAWSPTLKCSTRCGKRG